MGCGDTCPVFPGKRYEDWELADPAGQGVDAVRPIRDEHQTRIRGLRRRTRRPTGMTTECGSWPMTAEHADPVAGDLPAGIDEGNATFETTAPTWAAFDAAKLPEHRFVAVDDGGTVLGWVAAVPGLGPLRVRRGGRALRLRRPRRPAAAASAGPCSTR